MAAAYCAMDIACSSSAFGEGFSNAVGEAMACGIPCVVTDVGDSARIVGAGGEVAPPRNADAFAGALDRMLARLEEDAAIGCKARARIVDEFSVERMVLRTEQVVYGNN
jgi:glycosyltransferase involved in cell wall biosynthesis